MSEEEIVEPSDNDLLVLVTGESGVGKSASLRNIKNPERWVYFNAENKKLPFKSKFMEFRITDPYQVPEALEQATIDPAIGDTIDGAILDTITFLMDMFESQVVLASTNTQAAWGAYNQFFKDLMQKKVPLFNKPTVILGHLKEEYDEAAQMMRRSVPIKGALKNNGVEAYFSTVVAAKRMEVKKLKPYHSDLLTITEEDEDLGFKNVFQTRQTKETIGDRIRSPMGLFSKEQTFIDNDVEILMSHMKAFYA